MVFGTHINLALLKEINWKRKSSWILVTYISTFISTSTTDKNWGGEMRSDNLVVDQCSRPCPGSEDRGDDKMRDSDLFSGDKGSDGRTDRQTGQWRTSSVWSHVCESRVPAWPGPREGCRRRTSVCPSVWWLVSSVSQTILYPAERGSEEREGLATAYLSCIFILEISFFNKSKCALIRVSVIHSCVT